MIKLVSAEERIIESAEALKSFLSEKFRFINGDTDKSLTDILVDSIENKDCLKSLRVANNLYWNIRELLLSSSGKEEYHVLSDMKKNLDIILCNLGLAGNGDIRLHKNSVSHPYKVNEASPATEDMGLDNAMKITDKVGGYFSFPIIDGEMGILSSRPITFGGINPENHFAQVEKIGNNKFNVVYIESPLHDF